MWYNERMQFDLVSINVPTYVQTEKNEQFLFTS